MKLLCKQHSTYKAVRQPRSGCDRCWLRWLRKQNYELGRRISRLERAEIDT